MGRGVVEVSLLEKIDRNLCGDEGYRKDNPWCDIQNRQPVNLTGYSKFWDYVPFHTPDQVEFCQDYNDFYHKYEPSYPCAATTYELSQKLRQIVEGRGRPFVLPMAMLKYEPLSQPKSVFQPLAWYELPAMEKPREEEMGADGPPEEKPLEEPHEERPRETPPRENNPPGKPNKPPRIPSVTEIYALLSRGVAPSQRRMYRTLFLKKAKSIHQQMVEIDKLLAAKDPEADDKIMALYQEIEDTCPEPNPTVLKHIAGDCQDILNQHKNVKGKWDWIKGAIWGALGTVFLFFLKSGRGVKAVKAMKKAWRENKGIMRILGVFDAYNKISKAMDAEQPTPLPGTEPVPLPGMDEFDPMEELPGLEETPPTEEVSRLREGYRFKSDIEDTALLQGFKSTIRSFANITMLPFSTDSIKERLARFDEVMAYASNLDNRSKISIIAPTVHEEATLRAFEKLIDSYTEWLVKDRLAQVAREAGEAYKAIKRHGQQAVKETIKRKIETLKKISETIYNSIYAMGSLRLHLRKSIEGIHETMIIPNKTLVERWRTTIADVDGLIHDMEQIYPPLAAIIPKSEGDPKLEGQLERLSHYDLDRLDVSLGFVNRLNRSLASKHGVELELGEVPKLIIPEPMRFDLFRMINELANNAIKYADPSKNERYVRINIEVVEEQGRALLRIIIADNGIGMDPEDISRAFRGVRLRPDLAEGDGQGLPTIKNLADKHGAEVYIESVLGVRTKVTIEMDISDWEKTPPSGTGGPAASGAAPGGTGSPSGAGDTSGSTPASGTSSRVKTSLGSFDPQMDTTPSSPRWINTIGQAALRAARRRRKARGGPNKGMMPQPTPPVGPASASTQGALNLFNVRPLPVAP